MFSTDDRVDDDGRAGKSYVYLVARVATDQELEGLRGPIPRGDVRTDPRAGPTGAVRLHPYGESWIN